LILTGDGSADQRPRRHGCGANSNAVPGPVAVRMAAMMKSPCAMTRITVTHMRMARPMSVLR